MDQVSIRREKWIKDSTGEAAVRADDLSAGGESTPSVYGLKRRLARWFGMDGRIAIGTRQTHSDAYLDSVPIPLHERQAIDFDAGVVRQVIRKPGLIPAQGCDGR
jgi:hypothetical protein